MSLGPTRGGCVLLLLILAWPAVAEQRYVTDRLHLGVYENEQASGKRLKTLTSGAQVEILEKNRLYARVRAADGTTGWVKAAFLVEDPPAILRVASMEKQLEALRREAGDPAAMADRIRSLETDNRLLSETLQAVHAELERRETSAPTEGMPSMTTRGDAYQRPALVLTGGLLAGAALAGIGYAFGRRSAEDRIRSRLSGYRLG